MSDDLTKYPSSIIITYPPRLIKVVDGNPVVKRQLPAGWMLSDYSPQDNLIEIEDTGTFNRFWVSPKDFFVSDLNLGTVIRVSSNYRNFKYVIVTGFGEVLFRAKYYLTANLQYFNPANQEVFTP